MQRSNQSGVNTRDRACALAAALVSVLVAPAPPRAPAPIPPRTPAPTPPPWKPEVADKDDVVEVVEVMKSIISIEIIETVEAIIPNETAIIETVEPTKPIISIEVSIAKASHARR